MFNVAQFTGSWWSDAFGPDTITYSESTSSTQTLAKENLSNECSNHGHLFVTSKQSQGRGRGENTWTSPPNGTSFLGSILQRIPGPPQHIITPLFGWAVYKALGEAFPNSNFSIKAPNDIYLNDKKVAGLLLDSLSQGEEHWLVYGLGLNVFDSPDVELASSLKEEGLEVDEDSWSIFLRVLSADLTVVNQMSLNQELKPQFIKEITKGLKNYPKNYIKTLTPTADLIIDDKRIISWREL